MVADMIEMSITRSNPGYEWGDGRSEQKKRTAERAAAMAAMRPEYSYRQIGERFGVTKQWVAQMLGNHEYTEVMGHRMGPRVTRIKKICFGCGSDFGSTMPPSDAKRRKFCNLKCRTLFTSNHMTDRERERVGIALRLRKQGHTWADVGDALGYKPQRSYANGHIKNAAAKEGIDVSSAFGFTGKRNAKGASL